MVAGLARPGALIEIDAEAIVFAEIQDAGPSGTAGSDTTEGIVCSDT